MQKGGDLQVSAGALSESIPQLEAVILPPGFAQLDYARPIGTMGRYNKEGTLVVNLIISGTTKFAWLAWRKRASTISRGPGVEEDRQSRGSHVQEVPEARPGEVNAEAGAMQRWAGRSSTVRPPLAILSRMNPG